MSWNLTGLVLTVIIGISVLCYIGNYLAEEDKAEESNLELATNKSKMYNTTATIYAPSIGNRSVVFDSIERIDIVGDDIFSYTVTNITLDAEIPVVLNESCHIADIDSIDNKTLIEVECSG